MEIINSIGCDENYVCDGELCYQNDNIKKRRLLSNNDINMDTQSFEFKEFQDDKFFQKLGMYTCGLDKIIPWEDSNFVFSGGLLYDIMTNRYSNDLMDIDLFFFGSAESKFKTINKLLDRLDIEQYCYLVGINESVIYIFIQGIPRIIQLIMTDKTNPSDIINSFDLTHLMSWSNGTKIFTKDLVLEQLETKKSNLHIKINKNRIIKYIERGVDLEYTLLSEDNFVLTHFAAEKIIKTDRQINLYRLTGNLTMYSNYNLERIDFKTFDFRSINLNEYFGCRVNYDKLDNSEFKESINMFGAFTDYFGFRKNEIERILNPKKIIWDSSNLCYNVDLEDDVDNVMDDFNNNYFDDYIEPYRYSFKESIQSYTIHNKEYIYIPCKFVSVQKISIENIFGYKPNMCDKELDSLVYFQIDNKEVINYLVTTFNSKQILKMYKTRLSNQPDKHKKKNHLNINLPIYTFMQNFTILPNFSIQQNNSELDSLVDVEKISELPDNLIVFSKIKSWFDDETKDLEDKNFEILRGLDPGSTINCLFQMIIHAVYNNKEKNSVKHIDIEMVPKRIFKKDL